MTEPSQSGTWLYMIIFALAKSPFKRYGKSGFFKKKQDKRRKREKRENEREIHFHFILSAVFERLEKF